MVDVVCESQNFITHLEDASSISLRDVDRFNKIYNWFLKSLEKRKIPNLLEKDPNMVKWGY